MLDKKKLKMFSSFVFETVLLFTLPFVLLLPSELGPIATWNNISPILILRAIPWIFALLWFPGLYTLRLTGVTKSISRMEKFVLGVNLSLILIAIITLIFDFIQVSIHLLPWIFLGVFVFVYSLWWFKVNKTQQTTKFVIYKSNIILIVTIGIAVFLSFYIQIVQKYLIPGDIWVSLKPAVEVMSQRDVFVNFGVSQYPLMFGFILAGLSVCSGLPVVNTTVLLFPLVALNITSFFVLIKTVFQMNDDINTISSIIYAFGGGLACLFQIVIFQGTQSMWDLNYWTQDIYFSMLFWNIQEFSHRTLALTLSYSSIITFVMYLKIKNKTREILTLTLCSLFMLFSFYIHMIEPLVFVPMIILIAFVKKKSWSRYISIGYFTIITVIMAFSFDFFMSGYYTWLSIVKVTKFLIPSDLSSYSFYLVVGCISIIIVAIAKLFLFEKFKKAFSHRGSTFSKRYQNFFIIILLAIYLIGLMFIKPFDWWNMSPFPWYMNVTRYGFLGILALIGLICADWSSNWFKIASIWTLFILVMGSFWWGSKINAYIFSILALFAGLGIYKIWQKANFKLVTYFIIIILMLTFSTFIYGTIHYGSSSTSLTDSEAMLISRINKDVPENATVLVPNMYNIKKGVETIGDRNVYEYTQLPEISDPSSFSNLTNTLNSNNIRYLINPRVMPQSTCLDFLILYSDLLFQYGNLSVYLIPPFSPPSSADYEVSVFDRETVGFFGNLNECGWIDDNFIANWSHSNIDPKSDGEVLNFEWAFNSTNKEEPIMKTRFLPIDTDRYPYLIIRFRNTEKTSNYAQNTVRQIITLVTEEGYPEGFLENHYLPVSNEGIFQLYIEKLPENCSIAEVWIWMRNYENQSATVNLEIDYIGFVSAKSIPYQNIDTQLLPLALASLWPTNYSISSNFNEVNSLIVVSTYDNNVWTCIENSTDINTFVFFNSTATFPPLGTRWRTINTGIISGYFNGKRIIIVGTESLNNQNIFNAAQLIYEEIES